ncbi:D site-binding protein isoform X2 [Aplysia californica]|uniref:D site-binding protein isoform X2 n=1 Tax=Aplysia californica TaxID=6500 RepID=A0ABM1AEK6_APLCA|nr:D site-binding protein isoform X2 [Aplysia californica]
MILNVCFFPDRMNGDSSGYGGANGNGNYVTAPDSPGYYYNSGPNQMMSPQPPMGEQPQPQPQQQQQQPQQMPFAQGHQSSLFHFNSSSFSNINVERASPPDPLFLVHEGPTGALEGGTLAKAIATLSQDKNKRPRSEKKAIPEEQKDDKYFERRRRNNEAAKKSRDSRKSREDELAMRASILERKNAVLRVQVHSMREEALKLRQMWFEKCQGAGAMAGVAHHSQMMPPQSNGLQQNPLSSHQGRSS